MFGSERSCYIPTKEEFLPSVEMTKRLVNVYFPQFAEASTETATLAEPAEASCLLN